MKENVQRGTSVCGGADFQPGAGSLPLKRRGNRCRRRLAGQLPGGRRGAAYNSAEDLIDDVSHEIKRHRFARVMLPGCRRDSGLAALSKT